MLWSILIAAIPERYHSAQPLLYSLLEKQSVARMPDVELLYFMDNRRRTVGAKRNDLLRAAAGEYISFVDDDDDVSDKYVSQIHDTIVKARKQPEPVDVICFPQRATLVQQGVVHECQYSLDYWRDREPDKRRQLDESGTKGVLNWTGPPAHTMAWRKELLGGGTIPFVEFPEKNFQEDVDWVGRVCAMAKTEMRLVGPPLYFYNFDSKRTATR